jgi:hypothetical protein
MRWYLARRLARASRRELVDLLRAEWAIVRMRVRLLVVPQGELVRVGDASREAPVRAIDLARASELALAVERAAEHGPVSNSCLVRALAIRTLLQSEGIHGALIRVGVRMGATGFAAHAWVELAGTVIGDRREHVATFRVVDDIGLVHA